MQAGDAPGGRRLRPDQHLRYAEATCRVAALLCGRTRSEPPRPARRGGTRLHEWVFATRTGQRMLGSESGAEGLDDDFLGRGDSIIGATIMGRNPFGPIRGGQDVRLGGGVATIQQYLLPG